MSHKIQKQLQRLNQVERRLGGTLSEMRLSPGDETLERQMWRDLERAERELRRLERKLYR